MIDLRQRDSETPQHGSLWQVLCTDWKWWLPGTILSFFLGSVLVSGWPQGLVPNISYPFVYQEDALGHAWGAQRVIEGWLFENPRAGYPFGSDFYDFPGSDFVNWAIGKFFGLLVGSWVATINLYFLAGFPVIFLAWFTAMRCFGINRPLSWSGALLYTVLPFHFERLVSLGHIFYTWYFVAPIFFYYGLRLFDGKTIFQLGKGRRLHALLHAMVVIFLASFGVYYAFFGVIVLGTAAVLAAIRAGNSIPLQQGGAFAALIIFGVVLNTIPNMHYWSVHGKNNEVAARIPMGSEMYSLKLRHLVFPRSDHRVQGLASLARQYSQGMAPAEQELDAVYTRTVPLGAIGALGVLALAAMIAMALAGRRIDYRLSLLALLTWVLFLFGTIGGFGAIFSGTISPMIRAWDRISIFIGFGAITGLMLVSQKIIACVSRSMPDDGWLSFWQQYWWLSVFMTRLSRLRWKEMNTIKSLTGRIESLSRELKARCRLVPPFTSCRMFLSQKVRCCFACIPTTMRSGSCIRIL